MIPSKLIRQCADALEFAENNTGKEPCLSLQWPYDAEGRFPIRGELLCANDIGRVYSVRVSSVLAYVARALKTAPGAADHTTTVSTP